MINSSSRSTQLEPGTASEEVKEWAAGEQEKGFFRSVLGALGIHLAQREAYARGAYSRATLAVPAGQRVSLGISPSTWAIYVVATNQSLISGDLYLDGEYYSTISPARSISLELPHRGMPVALSNTSPVEASVVVFQSYYAEFSESRSLDLGPQPLTFVAGTLTDYSTLLIGWSLRETSGTTAAEVVLTDGAGGAVLAEISLAAGASSTFTLAPSALPAYNGITTGLTGTVAGSIWVR